MHTLHAVDLTESPGADSLWRKRDDSHHSPRSANPLSPQELKLPVEGFSSPFGFWFAETHLWTTGPPRLTVEFLEPVEHERAESRRARPNSRNHNHLPHSSNAIESARRQSP